MIICGSRRVFFCSFSIILSSENLLSLLISATHLLAKFCFYRQTRISLPLCTCAESDIKIIAKFLGICRLDVLHIKRGIPLISTGLQTVQQNTKPMNHSIVQLVIAHCTHQTNGMRMYSVAAPALFNPPHIHYVVGIRGAWLRQCHCWYYKVTNWFCSMWNQRN